MPHTPSDPLERLLPAWQVDCAPDPTLCRRVWDGVMAWEDQDRHQRLQVGGLAAVALVGGLVVWGAMLGWRERPAGEAGLAYRLEVDPLVRLRMLNEPEKFRPGETVGGVAAAGTGWQAVRWWEDQLSLDAGQREAFSGLHAAYLQRFDELFRELAQLHGAFQEVERQRVEGGVVDFLALYDLLERQSRVETMSAEMTADYLHRLAGILDARQWSRFQEVWQEAGQGLAPQSHPRRKDADA